MTLNSKSYLITIIFSFFGCVFITFWIIIFITFVLIGNEFNLVNLVSLPILIIPFFILSFIQNSLNRLKFTDNRVSVYKILIFKYKNIDLSSLDYSFYSIESGRNGSYEVMYLVKNKSLVLKISEIDFKNYYEIKTYILNYIENKGIIKLNIFEKFKYFTKGKINKLI